MDQIGHSTIYTVIIAVVTTISTGGAALWSWITKQLNECKAEHKESRNRIEQLHEDLKNISIEVGKLNGQVTVYRDYVERWMQRHMQTQHPIDPTQQS